MSIFKNNWFANRSYKRVRCEECEELIDGVHFGYWDTDGSHYFHGICGKKDIKKKVRELEALLTNHDTKFKIKSEEVIKRMETRKAKKEKLLLVSE